MTSAKGQAVRQRAARLITVAGRLRWLPAALVLLIGVLDLSMGAMPFHLVLTGVMDEAGHLATTALILLAVAGAPRLAEHATLTIVALAASMLIDIDHVPLYAGVPHVADAGGRPYSHSLTTVVVLAIAWWVTGRRWPVLAGAAIGVSAHFVRDVATGPGLQPLWPVSSEVVRLPYPAYVAVVVALGLVATVRAVAARRPDRPPA